MDPDVAAPAPPKSALARWLGVGLLAVLVAGVGARGGQLVTTSAPQEQAGFSLGQTADEVEAYCAAAGLSFHEPYERATARETQTAIACSVAKADEVIETDFGRFAVVEVVLCDAKACVLKFTAYDGAAFEPMAQLAGEAFGPVRSDRSQIPAACRPDGIVDCVRAGRASRLLIWTWPAFPGQIGEMLRLGHTATDRGEYVTLALSNRPGSRLF